MLYAATPPYDTIIRGLHMSVAAIYDICQLPMKLPPAIYGDALPCHGHDDMA